MKIKRLLTGGLAAIVTGAALMAGGLAATTFSDGMGSLVEITDSTYSSPLIVVGAGVDTTDVLGAADIAASLVSNYAVQEKTAAGAGSTTGVTGGVLIDSDLNKTYLAEGMNKVKTVITETDLPELLKTYTFVDMNSTTSTYTQKIIPAGVYATFGIPSGETDPYLYVPVTTSLTPYNLTVTFIGGLDPTAVDTSYSLTLFGKEYTFGNTHTNTSLELYSAAGAQVLTLTGAAAEETVTVGDQTFTIKLNGWNTGGTIAYLSVNGVAKTWTEGTTNTVNDVKFYVQSVDVMSTGGTDTTGIIKLFVGTDKLLMTHGSQLTRNDETENTNVYFNSPSASKINSITLEVIPTEDVAIVDGMPMVDPVFSSFQTVLSDMTPGMTDASRDLIVLGSDSTNVKLTFTNKDGMTYTNIPIFYGNSSNKMYKKVNNVYDIHTKECNFSASDGNISKTDYFVLSNGDYSYIMKYSSYSVNTDLTKVYVTLTDLATDTAYKVYPNAGEKLTVGSLEFGVTWNGNSDKTICVSLDGGTTYDGSSVNIKTGGGAVVNIASAWDNTGQVLITETPLYSISGSNNPSGTTLNITGSYSTTTGVRLTASPAGSQVGTNNEWKHITSYGTYVHMTGDNNGRNNVEIYNPGLRPAPANIAIGTNPVISTTAGTSGGTYNEAVPITNQIAKFPSEVSQDSTLDKNLILVGGPCANAIVKALLNTAWNVTDSCTAWFEDDTLKTSGNGLVEVVENAFESGKTALIVAGTDAADTRNLIANKVIKPTVYTGLGAVAQYKGAVA